MKAVMATKGSILELGSGIYSTPLLHWMVIGQRRKIWTVENDPEYFYFAKAFRSRYQRISLIEDWKDFKTDSYWSVALVDNLDGDRFLRAKSARYLKNKVDFILLHDAEAPEQYGYDELYKEFKYKKVWTYATPYTAVISNFKEITFI
jgi:hypothetical protein